MDLVPSSSTHIKLENDTKETVNFSVNFKGLIKHFKAEKEKLIEKQKLLQHENQNLDLEIRQLRKKLMRTKKQITSNEELEILQKCFSPNQIRVLQGQSKSRWSVDDLGVAFTIKSLCSRDFYIYLRTEMKYPLPAESNINRCYRSKNKTKKDSGGGGNKINKTIH